MAQLLDLGDDPELQAAINASLLDMAPRSDVAAVGGEEDVELQRAIRLSLGLAEEGEQALEKQDEPDSPSALARANALVALPLKADPTDVLVPAQALYRRPLESGVGSGVDTDDEGVKKHRAGHLIALPPGLSSMAIDQQRDLVELVWGSHPNQADVDRWVNQSFDLLEGRFDFCLAQHSSGPCGVLAALQGLLFRAKHFSTAERPEPLCALVDALAYTLYRAAKGSDYFLVLVEPDLGLKVGKYCSIGSWTEAVVNHPGACITSPSAVLGYVFSVVLSRGVARVRADMDDPSSTLIVRFGHCGQELVNLMLTGEATANVFDGVIDEGGVSLRGVSTSLALPVGYVSEMEALRYLTVGQKLKCPVFPLWVLGSPNHYTLLYGERLCEAAVSRYKQCESAARQAFDGCGGGEGFVLTERVDKLVKVQPIIRRVS